MRTTIFELIVPSYTYTSETDMPSTTTTNTIDIYAGDTPTLTFNLTQKGVKFSLSGYTATFYLKTSYLDTSYFMQVSGVVTTPTSAGKITVLIPATTNSGIGQYVAELVVNNSSTGHKATVFQSYFNINPSINL